MTTTAPIYSEPRDDADLPVVPVSRDQFDRIARTLGAGPVECDGELNWVRFNGADFCCEVAS